MEEVIGSIPIRSTNTFYNESVPDTGSESPLSPRVRKVLKFLQVQGKHQFNDFQARFALLLVDRAAVNIKRRAATEMSHQFLSDLNIDTKRSKVCRERMTEAVPADLFSGGSDPR
jgi:hypothetical protein